MLNYSPSSGALFRVVGLVLVVLSAGRVSGQGQAVNVETQIETERALEKYIHDIIAPHVEPAKFLITVKAKFQASASTAEEVTGGDDNLPYTTLKTNIAKLKSMMGKKRPDHQAIGQLLATETFDVDITFDQSVPQEKVQVLTAKVNHQLRIDQQSRLLNVGSTKLIYETPVETPKDPGKEAQLETAKLENERTRMEMERSKFDASRRQAELEDRLKRTMDDAQKQIEEIKKAQAEAAKKAEAEAQAKASRQEQEALGPQPGLVDRIRDFQGIIIAILVVLGLFIGAFVASGSHRKGMSALSEALTSVGDNIVRASEAGKTQDLGPGGDVAGEAATGKDATGETAKVPPVFDERYKEFIQLVEEKIEVLSNEGNFNFLRHFGDMIDQTPKLAAAILVNIGKDTARKLLDSLSADHVSRLRGTLAEPGAHSEAQGLRNEALQEFYGRIALDEYVGSPLGSVRNADWLTRLTTEDLRDLVLAIEAEKRTTFLSCLTPTRIAMILESVVNPADRDSIIAALKTADQTSAEQITRIFAEIEQSHKKQIEAKERRVASLIDGPRFFARLLTELKPESRQQLLDALVSRQDLMAMLRNYYIPFDALATVSRDTVKSIFGKRPANQIARILFTARQDVRDRIIEAVPEVLRDTVREDLNALLADKDGETRYRKESADLQGEICKYLLRLNREGLLVFDQESAPTAPPASVAGAA